MNPVRVRLDIPKEPETADFIEGLTLAYGERAIELASRLVTGARARVICETLTAHEIGH